MARPSIQQIERLVSFLEKNPDVAKGHIRTREARHATKVKWQDIAIQLNSIGGCVKNAKGWAKVWVDKKYYLKKCVAKRNSSSRQSGDDPDIHPLTEMDQKLISILGGPGFAEGKKNSSVNLSASNDSEVLPEDVEIIMINDLANAEQISGQESPVDDPMPSRHTHSQRQPRRRFQTRLEAEKERLFRIEDKKIDAEMATAASFESIAGSLNALADAIMVASERTERGLQSIANAVMVACGEIKAQKQSPTHSP